MPDGRLMFPPLAAGCLGTPAALVEFLGMLAHAYKAAEGCEPRVIAAARLLGDYCMNAV